MSRKKMVDGLITEFGKIIGIEELAMDDDNACTLGFDDLQISFQYAEDLDTMIVFSNLGRVTGEDKSELFQDMLTANFYQEMMGGTVLCYNKESTSAVLILHKKHFSGMNIAGFEEMLKNFTDLAESWTKRVRVSRDGGNDSPSGLSEPSEIFDPTMKV